MKGVWVKVEKMMVFDDIPPQERVIKIPVPRNEDLIQKIATTTVVGVHPSYGSNDNPLQLTAEIDFLAIEKPRVS